MRFLFALLFLPFCALAQVTISPIPQGFVGNSGTSSAPPAAITPQQAATMVQPYITGGGGSAGAWLNAAAPGNGCAGVVPGQDATVALQCQINWLATQHGGYSGGIIQIPPGTFLLSSTLVVKAGVTLWGSGVRATIIQILSDTTAIKFDSTVSQGGFRDVWVRCLESSAAVQNCVLVETGIVVILRDSWIWGGNWALETKGVDGLYQNLYINGWGTEGGGIKSTGSNWYIRNKVNCWPQAVNAAFYQGVTGGSDVSENHFSQSDFTGNYRWSLYVDDGGANTSVLTIDGSVFGSKISLPHHNRTILTGNEIGDTFFYVGNGNLIATGNAAFPAITVTGPGGRTCAGNLNLAC